MQDVSPTSEGYFRSSAINFYLARIVRFRSESQLLYFLYFDCHVLFNWSLANKFTSNCQLIISLKLSQALSNIVVFTHTFKTTKSLHGFHILTGELMWRCQYAGRAPERGSLPPSRLKTPFLLRLNEPKFALLLRKAVWPAAKIFPCLQNTHTSCNTNVIFCCCLKSLRKQDFLERQGGNGKYKPTRLGVSYRFVKICLTIVRAGLEARHHCDTTSHLWALGECCGTLLLQTGIK